MFKRQHGYVKIPPKTPPPRLSAVHRGETKRGVQSSNNEDANRLHERPCLRFKSQTKLKELLQRRKGDGGDDDGEKTLLQDSRAIPLSVRYPNLCFTSRNEPDHAPQKQNDIVLANDPRVFNAIVRIAEGKRSDMALQELSTTDEPAFPLQDQASCAVHGMQNRTFASDFWHCEKDGLDVG